MRHRASRCYTVVAALLLALGAVGTATGAASLTSNIADLSAVSSARSHEGADARHEAFAPRSTTVSPAKSGTHGAGPHLVLVAATAAVGAAALLLLGWFVVGRARHLLPRLVTAPLGARAPPALV
jgi:hypothetical protein